MSNGNAEANVEVSGADPNDNDEDAVQESLHECSVVSCVQVPKADWAINVSSTWSGTVRTASITIQPSV